MSKPLLSPSPQPETAASAKPDISDHTKHPEGFSVTFPKDEPLTLDCGQSLSPYTIAYQTYGTLNAQKSNAIIICHALTGDQHVANIHPFTGKAGWWDTLVGSGKPVDTDRFFVICPNIIGGCLGSTGPASYNEKTGKPYGLDFPVITIADMVRAQAHLIEYRGIDDLFCVIGGSMGGMQVLEWAASYPEKVFAAAPIATTARHSSQNIAFHEVGRQAIMADPEWHGGAYYEYDTRPHKGLAVARMAAHITYLSEQALHNKFGRNLQDRDEVTFGFDADFQVESYLRYQGEKFATKQNFDANTYLLMTKALDYFDPAAEFNHSLSKALAHATAKFLVVSFTSDWRFAPERSHEIVKALLDNDADVCYAEITSEHGHDAFLLPNEHYEGVFRAYMKRVLQDVPAHSSEVQK
ncbi:MAG: homoserine O-acetyltransferase [Thiomicrorhabdus sp.]|nr:homoserine O-acetyltransferase [Thiomicrorhabdus sp.]